MRQQVAHGARNTAKKRVRKVLERRDGKPSRDGKGVVKRARAAGSVTSAMIASFERDFNGEQRNRLALNAVTKNSLNAVALNRSALTKINHTFSRTVKVGSASHQKRSGRCWLFAGLNPMRVAAIKAMNLDEKFELSQNYVMFWDKFEKSNYFLENILKTFDEPVGSRLLDWLLQSPIQDDGQWDMFVNLINKYGILPKEFMPETDSSGNSGIMNQRVTAKLRENATELRRMHKKGASLQELRKAKETMLCEIYCMLAIHLGEPPKSFLWQWRDKKGKFHRNGEITPKEFFRQHVPYNPGSKVCLIHCPQKAKSYNTLYTIDYLGNVCGGKIIKYLNVELPVMKKAAIAAISTGEPVWFGCDVGKMLERDLGILDMELYDYESVYGFGFEMDKAERLDYGQSAMNHAMVFAGVDLDNKGKPTKWRVENSWGDEGGDKGFLVMTDSWFDEYVYEVAVDKKRLPKTLLKVLNTEPVRLPPWDPMGALAG